MGRGALTKWRRNSSLIAIAIGALFILTNCDPPIEQLMADAQDLYAAGNLPAAASKLSDVLTREPKNIRARLMSAQIYIDIGQGDAALGLLARAKQDGASDIELIKPRVQALLIARHYDEVVRSTDAPPAGLTNSTVASLLAFRGAAMDAAKRETEAHAALAKSLALDPKSVDAHVVATDWAIARRDFENAKHNLAEADEAAPKDRRLPQLRGNIAYDTQNFAEAERVFRNVNEAEPWNEVARGELAASFIAEDKLAEAAATLDEVLEDADLADVPKRPILSYVRAVVALRQKDYRRAQNLAEGVVKATPQFDRARLIAGAASYTLGEYERARYYLSYYVAQNPADLRGEKLLAAIQLKLGRPVEAAKTLEAVRDKAHEDPDLPRLVGLAAARTGDNATAETYLNIALSLQPNESSLRTELALADIDAGDPKAAIDSLEQVIGAHPDETAPQIPLFLALMQTKQYDKALSTAEHLIKSNPKNHVGELLVAAVYMTQRNIPAARAAFLKARELHPGDISANLNLAKLALADHKPDEARQYYQDILNANPQSIRTYISLAELEANAGRPQVAQAVLRKGAEANPTEPSITSALLRFQLVQGQAQQVTAAGEEALKKFPRNPDLLEIVGRAQLAIGERDIAVSTLSELVNVAPKSARAHAALAEAYLSKHTPDNPQWGAINEATAAVKLDPNSKVIKLLLGRVLITHRRFADARELVDELKATEPNDLQVIELDGVVASETGKLQEAIAAFEKAISLKDNPLDRRRLAAAEIGLGRVDDAGKTLGAWLQAHPEDREQFRRWADLAVKDGRFTDAAAQYAELAMRETKNSTVHNNLAWLLAKLGLSDAALAHARIAVALSPDSAACLDTFGYALLRSGKTQDAVEAFDKAWHKAADRPNIGFHLAEALAAQGKKGEAAVLLRGLLTNDAPFEERPQAKTLLDHLGG